jgi:exonuclease VII small subunit
MAIKLAVRRNPNFRFDYFLRSLPVDLLARRCEQLMKAAEKEVEQLEKKVRELAGLPTETPDSDESLPPIELPKFRVLQKQRLIEARIQAERDRKELEEKVAEIEVQIQLAQDRLKSLNEGSMLYSPDDLEGTTASSDKVLQGRTKSASIVAEEESVAESGEKSSENGAKGPRGKFVEFPEYDGIQRSGRNRSRIFAFRLGKQ